MGRCEVGIGKTKEEVGEALSKGCWVGEVGFGMGKGESVVKVELVAGMCGMVGAVEWVRYGEEGPISMIISEDKIGDDEDTGEMDSLYGNDSSSKTT